MIKIYNLKTKDDEQLVLVNKDYIDARFKDLADQIEDYTHEHFIFDFNDGKAEVINIDITDDEISAELIQETKDRSFISKEMLNSLLDRPTNLEITKKFDSMRQEVLDELNGLFGKLLNDSNALRKLKMFNNMLNDKEADLPTMELDPLKQHIDSDTHISADERRVLKELKTLMDNASLADWNATEGEPNYIANKPKALPADGGDANTIKGYKTEELVNKNCSNLIVGSECGMYKPSECDIILNEDYLNTDDVKNAIASVTSGIIDIRHGLYILHDIKINEDTLVRLAPDARFVDTKIILSEGDILSGGTVDTCHVNLNHRTTITGCKFYDCDIFLDGSYLNITSNTFTHCNFYYNGILARCIITNNRFNGNDIVLLAADNIIANNLKY